MRVIRCEHPDRPTASIRPFTVHGLDWDDADLPTPFDEGFDDYEYDRANWNCACHPNTLDVWFPKHERERIRERGYRFIELEVDQPVFVGRLQVLIRRHEAREIGEYLQ